MSPPVVGVDLVLGPGVGAGAVEMARAAGLDAVAAHLHVPEQGLAQRGRDVSVPDVVVFVRMRHVVGVGVDEVIRVVRTFRQPRAF